MDKTSRFCVIVCLATGLIIDRCSSSAHAQRLLQRIENRVNQRLQKIRERQEPPNTNSRSVPDGVPVAPSSSLTQDQSAPRPSFGLETEEDHSANGKPKVLVVRVQPGSPAEAAGLKVQDQITQFQGKSIDSIDALSDAVKELTKDETVLMTVNRAGRLYHLSGVFASQRLEIRDPGRLLPQPRVTRSPPVPSSTTPGQLGVVVENADPSKQGPLASGARIAKIEPDSPAELAKLQVGDRIVSIDGTLISNAPLLTLVMSHTRPAQQVEIQYLREQQLYRVSIQLAGSDGLAVKPDISDGTADTGTKPKGNATGQSPKSIVVGIGEVVGKFLGNKQNTKPSESKEELLKPKGTPTDLPAPVEVSNNHPWQERIQNLEAQVAKLEQRLKQLESAQQP